MHESEKQDSENVFFFFFVFVFVLVFFVSVLISVLVAESPLGVVLRESKVFFLGFFRRESRGFKVVVLGFL